jgi:hypothetical protein
MATMRPLNEGTLRAEFFNLNSQAQSYQQLADASRQRLADLKKRAHEAGLGKLWRELEHPTPIPPRIEEATTRVRVRESFSGEWRGMPYAFAAGTVADVPKSYAAHAVEMFERVDPSTPLFIPAPGAAGPRDAAPAPSPFSGLSGLLG